MAFDDAEVIKTASDGEEGCPHQHKAVDSKARAGGHMIALLSVSTGRREWVASGSCIRRGLEVVRPCDLNLFSLMPLCSMCSICGGSVDGRQLPI